MRYPPQHWIDAWRAGFGKKRERSRLLRGKAAEELNRQGAEAFMRFMDQAQGMMSRT
jgi:hypothetical protein